MDLNDAHGIEDDDAGSKLILVSQEQEKFPVTKRVAMMSELIRTIVESDASDREIPLPHVRSHILNKVIAYMRHHVDSPPREIERPIKTNIMSELVDQWDADFVDTDRDSMYELIAAADYLHIRPLLDLTCAKVATIMKNKTPEQIRRALNIPNDFTPEEEESVRAENRWAEDM